MIRRIALSGLAVVLAACAAPEAPVSGLPFYTERGLTPTWIAPEAEEYETIHRVADFALLNQDGEPITEESVEGEIYVASFFFTSCTQICPTLRSNLARVQDAVRGSGVQIICTAWRRKPTRYLC